MKTNQTNIEIYINLSTITELPKSIKSIIFIYSNVKSKTTKTLNLNKNEKIKFKVKRKDYKFEFIDYKKKTDALKSLKNFIILFIDRFHIMHFVNQKTIYQKFNVLRIRLISTNHVRKVKIIKKYKKMQRVFKFQNID